MTFLALPVAPGAYVLEFCLEPAARLVVGRLGAWEFPAGRYFYVGSAQGSGGLRGRLGRHLRPPTGAPHWHVDYLRGVAMLAALAYLPAPPDGPAIECCWSQALAAQPESWIPVPGFGASDCRRGCPAHLIGWRGVPLPAGPVLNRPALVAALAGALDRPSPDLQIRILTKPPTSTL